MKVVVLAGEKSGDLIGFEIVKELTNHNIEVFGLGGEEMLKNGLKESFFDISNISLMGFVEVLPKIFLLKKLIKNTAKHILSINPDFIITIDSPGFNTRVIKLVKKMGYLNPAFHAVAPTVWAYKEKRAKKFALLFNEIFCILPFEPPYFKKYGLKATYICYPPLIRLSKEIEEAKNCHKKHILLNIGSRLGEIKKHLKIAAKIVKIIQKAMPEAKFAINTFPEFANFIKQKIPSATIAVTKEERLLNMQSAYFCISKSGTVAMEGILFEVPSVVFYKGNVVSYFIIKLMVKIKFVTLANIILKKMSIPEFIQFNAKPNKIASEVTKILQNPDLIKKQKADIGKVKTALYGNYKNFGYGVVSNILNNL